VIRTVDWILEGIQIGDFSIAKCGFSLSTGYIKTFYKTLLWNSPKV